MGLESENDRVLIESYRLAADNNCPKDRDISKMPKDEPEEE